MIYIQKNILDKYPKEFPAFPIMKCAISLTVADGGPYDSLVPIGSILPYSTQLIFSTTQSRSFFQIVSLSLESGEVANKLADVVFSSENATEESPMQLTLNATVAVDGLLTITITSPSSSSAPLFQISISTSE